ncbi:MarR family transcriptional regulator [Catellatospora tritici]|uniref:MarR family transcriptional regulator n=1 Tax=Catellatospora tritici TaxID=2851566 RepID=UPI001C2CDA36|nr:MarR family transcriptional regulator [Catellatospora tritici]MBV1851550.1 MarR family transcriptional regulator [Catellatospora tritici]
MPEPDASAARAALVERLHLAGREISAAAVMFHTALAARHGLSATEEKALDLLDRHGPMTPRELGTASGLAPASVTGLIDRLERKGFARRAPHPQDRRSVLVEVALDRAGDLGPLFEDWVRSLDELLARYSDAELAVIIDFLSESAARQRAATTRLSQQD